jgi:hypothetical protein
MKEEKKEQVKTLGFRPLNADEIDCRVGTVTDKGCSLLMYKDARVDMRLLDEVVGCTNWKREHELINGNLFCTVSIWDEVKGVWVSKQDVGVESNTEKEKGQASDAFKRACFNWGIGRELYTCPFVWINLAAEEWRTGTNGKKVPKTRFHVTNIEYQDGVVSYLRIVDDGGAQRFVYGTPQAVLVLLEQACEEVKNAQDVDVLRDVYLKYKDRLAKEKTFINIVNVRKDELQKAA